MIQIMKAFTKSLYLNGKFTLLTDMEWNQRSGKYFHFTDDNFFFSTSILLSLIFNEIKFLIISA